MSFYKKGAEDAPHILLIDPITGQLMRAWSGYIDPDRFLEDIMDFITHG